MNAKTKRFLVMGAIGAALPLSMLATTAASAQVVHPAHAASAVAVAQDQSNTVLILNLGTGKCLSEDYDHSIAEVDCDSPSIRHLTWTVPERGETGYIWNTVTGDCLTALPNQEVRTSRCAPGTTRWTDGGRRLLAHFDFPYPGRQCLTSSRDNGVPYAGECLLGGRDQDWAYLPADD